MAAGNRTEVSGAEVGSGELSWPVGTRCAQQSGWRVDHDLAEGAGLALQRTLGLEIHGTHLPGQLLQAVGGNAPVAVDDPSGNDGIVDAGKEAHQVVETAGLDAKLFVGCATQEAILDRLDRVGTSFVDQPPQRDRLLQEFPAILGLGEDFSVFEGISTWDRSDCV